MQSDDLRKRLLYRWIYSKYYELTSKDRELLSDKVTALLKEESCDYRGLDKDVIVQLPGEKARCSLYKILKDNLDDVFKKNERIIVIVGNNVRVTRN